MSEDKKHAGLPWILDKSIVKGDRFTATVFQIIKPAGKYETYNATIATTEFYKEVPGYIETPEANAEFIVRACNSHYELLGFTKSGLGAMEEKYKKFVDLGWSQRAKGLASRIELQKIAIAKAEGK